MKPGSVPAKWFYDQWCADLGCYYPEEKPEDWDCKTTAYQAAWRQFASNIIGLNSLSRFMQSKDPLTPAEERARALTSTLHEICGLIREHNAGKALDVAERAIGAPDQFTAACATIREALTNDPGLRSRVFRDVVIVLDNGRPPVPLEVTACQIINTLFGTTLVITPQISTPLIYDEQP